MNSDHFFSNSVRIRLEAMALSYVISLHVTVRSSFFAQRVINVWNSLPTSGDFSTLSAFKGSLQRINF